MLLGVQGVRRLMMTMTTKNGSDEDNYWWHWCTKSHRRRPSKVTRERKGHWIQPLSFHQFLGPTNSHLLKNWPSCVFYASSAFSANRPAFGNWPFWMIWLPFCYSCQLKDNFDFGIIKWSQSMQICEWDKTLKNWLLANFPYVQSW